ncbi:MAG: hypothetical protein AAGE65_10325, partial [Planctomycetota bacterium]
MSTIDPAQAKRSASEPVLSQADARSARRRRRRAESRRFFGVLPLHVTLTAVGFMLALPFLWMVLTSFKPLDQIGQDDWLPTLSANTDRGQFSAEAVETLRDAIRRGDTATTAFLQAFVNTQAETLRPEQFADQLNAAIQRGEPIPPEAYAGVALSPEALAQLARVVTDAATPIPQNLIGSELNDELRARARNIALFNAYVLHDALPGLISEPVAFRAHNYLEVFRQVPFARYYLNSLFIACWVTFLQVFTSSLAAFSFARLEWPGRDKVFLLYLSTMMLPGLVMMIP